MHHALNHVRFGIIPELDTVQDGACGCLQFWRTSVLLIFRLIKVQKSKICILKSEIGMSR
jgi:hypothetical protein